MSDGQKEEKKTVHGESIKFNCTSTVLDNYRYRDAVDNMNALRHDGGGKYIYFEVCTGKNLVSHSSVRFLHRIY